MNYASDNYRIRIVDDDKALLQAMKLSLELDGWIVETYASAMSFLEQDDNEILGCLILDYQMPEINGIELQQLLIDQGVTLPIIFLTAHAEVNVVIKAFKEGAYDFLLKPVDPDVLSNTIIKSIEKNEEFKKNLAKATPLTLYSLLTDQQKQVARLVAQGLTCAVIGERLGKSRRTIERHRGNVMRQMKVSSPQQLRKLLQDIQVC